MKVNISKTSEPGKQLELQKRRTRMAKLFADNPRMTHAEIAMILGVHVQTVGRDMEIICRELRNETNSSLGMLKQYYVKELDKVRDEAWKRINHPSQGMHQGARWMDQILLTIDMGNRMFGFYAPKRYEIHETVAISKEQADAALKAAMKSEEYNNQIEATKLLLEDKSNEENNDDAIDAEVEEAPSMF